LIRKHADRVRIFTRNGAEYTDRLPRMAEWFRHLPVRSVVLDGELCYIGPDGRVSFHSLMGEMHTRAPDERHLMFFAFDLLHLDGVDLRVLPLSERKRDLVSIGAENCPPVLRPRSARNFDPHLARMLRR
jgi:bifunctional non-homologous end joining protein LigD